MSGDVMADRLPRENFQQQLANAVSLCCWALGSRNNENEDFHIWME